MECSIVWIVWTKPGVWVIPKHKQQRACNMCDLLFDIFCNVVLMRILPKFWKKHVIFKMTTMIVGNYRLMIWNKRYNFGMYSLQWRNFGKQVYNVTSKGFWPQSRLHSYTVCQPLAPERVNNNCGVGGHSLPIFELLLFAEPLLRPAKQITNHATSCRLHIHKSFMFLLRFQQITYVCICLYRLNANTKHAFVYFLFISCNPWTPSIIG